MCLLTFFPPGITPDPVALDNGAYNNPDGHGFALVAGNRLIVARGMDPAFLIEDFINLRHEHPGGPALFHSRFATHGPINDDNCHPFQMGGDPRTVVAHNGILPKNVRPNKGDPRSDTCVAVEDFLPADPFGPLGNNKARARLSQWLGPGNKLVILTVNPRYRRRAYVINEHAGIWDSGIWYSNLDYQYTATANRWDSVDWTRDYRCQVCNLAGTADNNWYCGVCGSCMDCGDRRIDCQCYAPAYTA
jgi:glutamine amidotransferase